MAVKPTYLTFTPSDSPDVNGYYFYMEETPNPVDINLSQKWDLGNPPVEADGKIKYDISTLDGITTKDGVYNIGLSAYDEVGNESSLMLINDVALDFIAPNPPSDGAIIRG